MRSCASAQVCLRSSIQKTPQTPSPTAKEPRHTTGIAPGALNPPLRASALSQDQRKASQGILLRHSYTTRVGYAVDLRHGRVTSPPRLRHLRTFIYLFVCLFLYVSICLFFFFLLVLVIVGFFMYLFVCLCIGVCFFSLFLLFY